MIGRRKMSFFNDIKLKVLSKISSRQYKMFLSGGKEILIKAVAQAVPAYGMSVFKIPKGLCDDIQRVIAKFFFFFSCGGGGEAKENKHGIHWSKWNTLMQKAEEGWDSEISLASIKLWWPSKVGDYYSFQIH